MIHRKNYKSSTAASPRSRANSDHYDVETLISIKENTNSRSNIDYNRSNRDEIDLGSFDNKLNISSNNININININSEGAKKSHTNSRRHESALYYDGPVLVGIKVLLTAASGLAIILELHKGVKGVRSHSIGMILVLTVIESLGEFIIYSKTKCYI